MAEIIVVDELYSVSDLHMGGSGAYQIFCQGRELAALIDLLAARPPERHVALVLNGDIVDFLAEDESSQAYLKPKRAVDILNRIIADPSFAMVFAALARYVRTHNRLLVLCLGNHDVELALPASQVRINQELCGDDRAAVSRILWAVDGQGFRCIVGPAQVFCTHGNEVDSWNLVDYAQLERVKAALLAEQEPPPWDPNAGTQLVIDVMNKVKGRYPFVDLLKPETKLVPPMVLSLDSRYLNLLGKFGSILYRKLRGSARILFRVLGGPEDDSGSEPHSGLAEEEFVRNLVMGPEWQQVHLELTAEQILEQMEADWKAGRRPLAVLDLEGQQGTLGLPQFVLDHLTGRPKAVALREAIADWLKNDTTFDFKTRDETFEMLDKRLDSSYDFVLAGHTHLARALQRNHGRGAYFNSGTWIRLIRLSEAVLESQESFAPAYAALTEGSLAALDRAENLRLLRPTVVRVISQGSQTIGELTRVRLDAQGHAVLDVEPQTSFSKR